MSRAWRGKTYPYTTLDDANHYFLSVRQTTTIDDAKLECEINRFAIKVLLSSISDEHLVDVVKFPWGEDCIAEFIQGAIDHERKHIADILSIQGQ